MEAALQDPNHGKLYISAGAITNRPEEKASKGYRIAREGGIEPVYIEPNEFPTREHFHAALTRAAEDMKADILCLSGFLKKYSVISDPTLTEYRDRIANVHPAPLTIVAYKWNLHPLDIGRDVIKERKVDMRHDSLKHAMGMLEKKGWSRLYTGDDPVFMAALFGEESTCSVINMVEEGVDAGAVAAMSPEKRIDQKRVQAWLDRNAYDRVRSYADKLQGEMKTDCDGPVFRKFLELTGSGKMTIDGQRIIVDGQQMPYGGFLMEE